MTRPARAPGGGVELRVEDDPDPADLDALDAGVAEATLRATRLPEPRPLAVLARQDGVLVGGAHGWTWGGCCEVVTLWVSEERRGCGMGRALLARVEEAAARRGCRLVVAFTHDVQAPGLYRAAGYTLVATVEGYPAGGAAHWFRKPLGRVIPMG